MSAFVVGTTHIDALVTAGLAFGGPGWALSWYYPAVEREANTYEAGAAWGPAWPDVIRQRTRTLTEATAGRVGAVLLAENQRSVNFRYAEGDFETPYLFRRLTGRPDPVVVLKALDCYEYQACEHPSWCDSEAFQICQALRRAAIAHLGGYDQAPWPIDDRLVFTR